MSVPNGLSTTDLNAAGMSPATLASALVGPGVSVSNVSFTGNNAQGGLGHLVDPAVVSFNDGVMLSSGDIANMVGPNKSDSITGDMGGQDDADLNALIANTQTVYPMTFDAASLEFDFVPSASPVYFTYTFGSDEYLEWVNLFNDVFAFYVNGQNCATVPNGDPISIDTINSNVNSQLFRDNAFSSPVANPINIEADGLSVEMICSAPVNVGQTNHMKLAIADTSDQILDSFVMLKSQSLSTVAPESCNNGVDDDDDLQIDDSDSQCSTTTTPPPVGSSGIGSSGKKPAFTGYEGTPILLDGEALNWHASNDTITTTWTVDGINGTVGSCEIIPPGPQDILPDRVIAPVEAICPHEGEYVARVEGWDIEGASAFDKDVDFFVQNAPPAVTIDEPASTDVAVGAPFTVSASVADPGDDDVTCSISWGDGTESVGDVVDGVCSGTYTYGETGSQIVSIMATDSAGSSAAAALVLSISNADTVVVSNINPSVKGQAVTFTGATTLGTGGSMQFFDGATLIGNRSVKNGQASFTTSSLPVGTHAITVAYKKTSGSVPSVSGAIVQQVDQAATTASLTSTVNPAVFGQVTTVKATVATVAPGVGLPTGTVDLFDGGNLVATKMVSNGAASFALRPTVGTHDYTAVYNGSASSLGSTSDPLTQTVTGASTTTALSSTTNPTVSGQVAVIKATVAAVAPSTGKPTGSVELYDGSTLVATKSLSSGAASFGLRPSVGSHAYTAVYSGDAGYGGSTADPLTQVVDRAATTVAVTSSANPSVFGQSVAIRALVAPVAPGYGKPDGTVDLYDGSTLVASKALMNGSATFSVKPSLGSHSYTAVYGGSASYVGATSTSLAQEVDKAYTKVTLSSTYPTTTLGHAGNITASVAVLSPGSGVPTGTVEFYDGATLVASAPVVAGKATMPIAALPVGVHHLGAVYLGSDSFQFSLTASELIQTIS